MGLMVSKEGRSSFRASDHQHVQDVLVGEAYGKELGLALQDSRDDSRRSLHCRPRIRSVPVVARCVVESGLLVRPECREA